MAICLALCGMSAALAQTTAFTYQGKLTDAGNPANGNYDLQLKLFDPENLCTDRMHAIANCYTPKLECD